MNRYFCVGNQYSQLLQQTTHRVLSGTLFEQQLKDNLIFGELAESGASTELGCMLLPISHVPLVHRLCIIRMLYGTKVIDLTAEIEDVAMSGREHSSSRSKVVVNVTFPYTGL